MYRSGHGSGKTSSSGKFTCRMNSTNGTDQNAFEQVNREHCRSRAGVFGRGKLLGELIEKRSSPWPKVLHSWPPSTLVMGVSIEIDEDLYERIQTQLEEGEEVEEFIEELVNVYETEGVFLREGYSE